ncbi:MAG: head-tail connector protein, partial [Synergistaceae bacterium]|nr:head-tail connector protein [Synergistaceae bacterium]
TLMAETMNVKELRQLVAHVEGQREKRLPVWRELSHFMLPSRGQFPGEERENLRNHVRFNNVAARALRRSAAGLTEAMTPASLHWFRHDFLDKEQREVTFARDYADAVDERLGAILSKGKFYNAIHVFNMDLLCFGCAMLYAESSDISVMRYYCPPVGSYAVALDEDGELAFVCHRMFYTAKSMVNRWGKDRVSDKVLNDLQKQPYKEHEVVHVVMERPGADTRKMDAMSMPFASYWYEAGMNEGDFLSVGGYNEMPFFFTTWTEGRGVYGVGPGDEALTDTKGVENWELYKTIGLEKTIDPPVMVPGMLKGRANTNPGAQNSVLGAGNGQQIAPLYQIQFGPALQLVQQEVQVVTNRIEDSLMASVFASISMDARPAQMSATEFMARKREAAQQTGPAISMYEPQILDKVLSRTFNAAQRLGLMPDPPEGLGGDFLLNAEYLGPLSQMLRQTGSDSTRQLVTDVAQLAQLQPDILDKLDMDQIVDELARGIAAPGSVVRSDEQVAEIRQARADAQAQQQQQAMALEQQKNDIAAANVKTEGTMAGAMMGQQQ